MQATSKIVLTPIAAGLVGLLVGCGGYGEISPRAYEYAKALYSITNRHAEDKLPEVAEQIKAAANSGDLSASETDWFTDIIADAEAGRWKEANKACRTMMEDQVR